MNIEHKGGEAMFGHVALEFYLLLNAGCKQLNRWNLSIFLHRE